MYVCCAMMPEIRTDEIDTNLRLLYMYMSDVSTRISLAMKPKSLSCLQGAYFRSSGAYQGAETVFARTRLASGKRSPFLSVLAALVPEIRRVPVYDVEHVSTRRSQS
jgi:hypothetical protein